MLKDCVKNEGLKNIIIFTGGYVTNMPAVYNELDVMVSTATGPEPLDTVVIESMALGQSLISPEHGGVTEMMSLDETGLLFTPKEANSLSNAIEVSYNSATLRTTLGQTARKHINNR